MHSRSRIFVPLCLCIFKLRLATDHWLREVHLRVAAAVPLCHLHLVYRFQSPPGFPPHSLPAFLPVCRPDKGAVHNWRSTDVVSQRPFRSRERSEGQLSALRRHASAESYTDLPLCQSQTHVPSLPAVRTLSATARRCETKNRNALSSAFHTRVTLSV